MRTIEFLLGGIIVVSTLLDIFQSVVVPRPTRGSLRLAPFLLDGMWPLWKWIALSDALHSLVKYWVVSHRKF